ncbi:MAG: hypothetical protein EOO21_06240 [Comamonadaceae bacterium]|nr:MAG: hypothetical protein EOO21_06240 [Comamonadaceae bacterium]
MKGFPEFVAMLRKGRGKFQAIRAGVPPATLEEQMLLVRFEDVVRDDATRQGILRKLDLDPAGLVPDLTRFDPSVSARNIGIHVGQLTPQEHASIEADIGIYLA